ncbi:UNVERIFIED_CONTAM: hypothetical protein Sangu_2423200 [Sesamum angustifolium]|uniref:Uncharacterized protein n=1 Tax=Sesamum angustifolium TaxID=2727405 RepID=A0AAW2KWG5_9LAMI
MECRALVSRPGKLVPGACRARRQPKRRRRHAIVGDAHRRRVWQLGPHLQRESRDVIMLEVQGLHGACLHALHVLLGTPPVRRLLFRNSVSAPISAVVSSPVRKLWLRSTVEPTAGGHGRDCGTPPDKLFRWRSIDVMLGGRGISGWAHQIGSCSGPGTPARRAIPGR